MKISQASGPPASMASANPVSQAGLSVAAIPVRDSGTLKSYFGTGTIPDHLLVVFINAQNPSSEADWLLHRANVRLNSVEPAGISLAPSGVNHRNKGAEAMAVAGAALISLPLLIAGNIAATDATVVQHNFAVRQWRDGTLSSQESREGFLYFQFPTAIPPASKYILQIDALNFRNQRTNSVHIPISL